MIGLLKVKVSSVLTEFSILKTITDVGFFFMMKCPLFERHEYISGVRFTYTTFPSKKESLISIVTLSLLSLKVIFAGEAQVLPVLRTYFGFLALFSRKYAQPISASSTGPFSQSRFIIRSTFTFAFAFTD